MTVLARNNEPQGTYVEGYDAGLEDAANGAPRKYRRPTPRQRNASFYREGYAEGYSDGKDRKLAVNRARFDPFGRPRK